MLPPVFDIAGTRVAVSFDLARDMESLPVGTDLVIYFPAYGYDDSNEETAAVASIRDGFFVDTVAKTGLWLAAWHLWARLTVRSIPAAHL